MTQTGDFYALKTAQRDLIERCGGLERVMRIGSYSRSQVGRWNSDTSPDMMSIAVACLLERDCRVPYVTRAMAGLHGRTISDPDDGEDYAVADVQESMATTMAEFAELFSSYARAASDGMLTGNELTEIQRKLSDAANALTLAQQATSSARAGGGQSAALTIVAGLRDKQSKG